MYTHLTKMFVLSLLPIFMACQLPENENNIGRSEGNANTGQSAGENIQLEMPAQLAIVQETITSSSLELSWEPVENALGYLVSWGGATDIAGADNGITSRTRYVITDLSPATQYHIRVKALSPFYGNYANSDFTPSVSTTTDIVRNWHQVTASASWLPRYAHTSVVFKEKIVVIGGNSHGRYMQDLWYSSDGKTWNDGRIGHTDWKGRIGHSSVVFEYHANSPNDPDETTSRIFILGGSTGTDDLADTWYSLTSDNNDPIEAIRGRAYVKAPDNPVYTPRSEHTSVVHEGKIWIIGGYINGVGSSNDVFHHTARDFGAFGWNTVSVSSPIWTARYDHSSVVHDGKIWVIGGEDSSGTLNDVWSSTDGARWTKVTSPVPWAARSGHSSVVCAGKIWVLGGTGADGTLYNDVWSSPDGENWTEHNTEADTPRWEPREAHSSVVYDNKIWVIGGGDTKSISSKFHGDVWSYSPGEEGC